MSFKSHFRGAAATVLTIMGTAMFVGNGVDSMRKDFKDATKSYEDKIENNVMPTFEEAKLYKESNDSFDATIAGALLVIGGFAVMEKSRRDNTLKNIFS